MAEQIVLLDLASGDITKYTPLLGSIDIDSYKFCVLDAQNSKLKELLGDSLYTKIETDYDAGTLAGDYLILYNEFIFPILRHQATVEYLEFGALKVANGGIFKHSPANGTPADASEVKELKNSQRLKAEMYIERCQRWLYKIRPAEYIWHYENIVNPTFSGSSSLNFDFITRRTKDNTLWDGRNDSRTEIC